MPGYTRSTAGRWMVEDVFEACDVDVGIDPRASLGFGHRQPMGLDRAGVATRKTPPQLLLVKSPAVMQIGSREAARGMLPTERRRQIGSRDHTRRTQPPLLAYIGRDRKSVV